MPLRRLELYAGKGNRKVFRSGVTAVEYGYHFHDLELSEQPDRQQRLRNAGAVEGQGDGVFGGGRALTPPGE